MTPYGFVEVNDGSDAYLQRVLELARRLSQVRPVVLRLAADTRPRVEAMMGALFSASERSLICLLDRVDGSVAIPTVQAAGFCVLSDAETAAHLGADQVAVYSRFPVAQS